MADLDLLVLGDVNPDLVLRGDVRPAFGQVEQLVEHTLVVGGSGAITACGAARLGLRTALCGVVGDDPFGAFMVGALSERGVGTAGIVTGGRGPTGLSVILSDGTDRAILTSPGTVEALSADDVDLDLVRSARHVHVSSYFLQRSLRPGLASLFEEAHRAGATTSVDPNWDASGGWDDWLLELLPHTDVFLPNAAEAIAIARVEVAEDAARTLGTHGGIVAVKLGEIGAVAAQGDELVHTGAPRVDVVDAVGAGDSFDAGFIAGLLASWPLSRCLGLAVACGALSTRAVGGTGGQPTMAEALEALRPERPLGS